MTASISVPEFLYRIAIEGLPVEMQSIRSRCIYWINVAETGDSVLIAKSILNHASSKARGILIDTNRLSLTDEDLDSAALAHDLLAFSLTENTLIALRALATDLDRSMRPRQRTLLLCLPSIMFADASREQFRSILSKWQSWLVNVDCAMIVLCSGQDALSLTDHLMAENDLLSGLSYIKRTDSREISYQCSYWRNIMGVVAPRTLILKQDDIKLGVVGLIDSDDPVSLDAQPSRYIVERAALSGFSVSSQRGWEIVESSSAAYQLARTATNATVLFALHNHSELPELAKLLHQLRLERGPVIRLVVRELTTQLRFQSEQNLLDCGASLVVGVDVGYTRFLSLLESVQSMRYNRKLVESPDSLFESTAGGLASGIVDPSQFIKHVRSIFSGPATQQPLGLLVVMRPVPGLTTEEALKLLNLRRLEDVACQLAGNFYLFLHGCLPSLASVVLEKLFVLPFDEIFSTHSVYEDGTSIDTALEQMQTKLKSEPRHSAPHDVVEMLEDGVDITEPSETGNRDSRYLPQRVTLEMV